MNQDDQDQTIYTVVVNHEEQYSIWPTYKNLPLGWKDAGKSGPKAECLAYIEEVWTDMRPLSLRKHMEEVARQTASQTQEPVNQTLVSQSLGAPPEDDLVKRLCESVHAVEASLRPEKTVPALQERINRGYVHIKFTETRGGTELGVRLDPEATDLSHANFVGHTGTVHLEGRLTLNYVKVRCIADIDLQTLTGQGRLERVVE